MTSGGDIYMNTPPQEPHATKSDIERLDSRFNRIEDLLESRRKDEAQRDLELDRRLREIEGMAKVASVLGGIGLAVGAAAITNLFNIVTR